MSVDGNPTAIATSGATNSSFGATAVGREGDVGKPTTSGRADQTRSPTYTRSAPGGRRSHRGLGSGQVDGFCERSAVSATRLRKVLSRPDTVQGFRSLLQPPPSFLESWTFHWLFPPYIATERSPSPQALVQTATEPPPPRGGIILCNPPEPNPTQALCGIQWLRHALPWASIAVVAPKAEAAAAVSAFLTRASRRGAVVLAVESPPEVVSDAVLRASYPSHDLVSYLRATLPCWATPGPDHVLATFIEGFQSPPPNPQEKDRPSRRPLWTLFGRALKAACLIQQSPASTTTALAHLTDYADFRSMDRALMRWMGVFSRQIKGTVGWEWLCWRFLSGQGDGRLERWYQYPRLSGRSANARGRKRA